MQKQKRRVYVEIYKHYSFSICYFNSLKEAKNIVKEYISAIQTISNVQIIRNEKADVTLQEDEDVRITIYIESGTDEPDNDVEVIIIKPIGGK